MAPHFRRWPLVAMLVVSAVTSALAQPPDGTRIRPAGRPVHDQYVVVLKPGVVDAADVSASAAEVANDLAGAHGGERRHVYSAALHGFSVRMPRAAAEALARDPRVDYVAEDGIVEAIAVRANPAWGLDRIDQRNLPLNAGYTYDFAGGGVRVYIIDTGIRAAHNEFGGRVGAGFDAINDGNGTNDCHGHGTHVAGTVGGATYGVANQVTLYPVRVLGCNGSGAFSQVIAGVDWVTANHVKPAVANMSLGGGVYPPLDTAVTNSVNAGVTYVVAAGNENTDACLRSPARAAAALTVGATMSNDARSGFSNFGTCLDLFAPGSSITSAWNTSNSATAILSGTSMASPHVAGVAALYLGQFGHRAPATVAADILANATSGVVSSPGTGSPNRMLYSLAFPSILGVTLTANRPSPQAPGTAITLTANPVGPSAGVQYKWWFFNGMSWSIARDWNTGTSVAWTPAAVGNYIWAVWARGPGSTVDFYEHVGSLTFAIQASPLSSISLIADQLSPQQTGTTITFLASATGGTTPYQSKWRLFDGTSWSVLRDWSTAMTFQWTPMLARSYTITVWGRSAGNGADAAELAVSLPFTITRALGLPPRGDFDGSGTSDVLWRDRVSGANTLWKMNGMNVPVSAPVAAVADLNWEIKGAADLDADGKSDLVWRNAATGQNTVWLMDGAVILGGNPLPVEADLNWKVKGVADFDGDGRADILWRHSVSGTNRLWFMNGGALRASASLPAVGTTWDAAAVGDFNGDGKADIAWRSAIGENSIWLLSGASLVGAGYVYSVTDLNWEMKGTGDVDGNGNADIVWRNKADGQNSVWLMNGLAIVGGANLYTVDLNWSIQGVGDFDNDRKADIFWRNTTTGQNSLWLLNGIALKGAGYSSPMGLTANVVSPR